MDHYFCFQLCGGDDDDVGGVVHKNDEVTHEHWFQHYGAGV